MVNVVKKPQNRIVTMPKSLTKSLVCIPAFLSALLSLGVPRHRTYHLFEAWYLLSSISELFYGAKREDARCIHMYNDRWKRHHVSSSNPRESGLANVLSSNYRTCMLTRDKGNPGQLIDKSRAATHSESLDVAEVKDSSSSIDGRVICRSNGPVRGPPDNGVCGATIVPSRHSSWN